MQVKVGGGDPRIESDLLVASFVARRTRRFNLFGEVCFGCGQGNGP